MHWYQAINECASQNRAYVIASVLATSGSAPREAGTKMVITATATHDTIGGGGFEHLAVARARDLLAEQRSCQTIEHFPLGASAQQCCGGSVTVLFECFAQTPLEVVVFGAGHVGSRVMHLLSELNAKLRWIDNRQDLPNYSPNNVTIDATADATADTPKRVQAQLEYWPKPADVITEINPGAYIVIVTHDHQLDYELISALLTQQRNCPQAMRGSGGIGLIGSKTKWQRFSKRLLRDGFSQIQIDQINCPIGDPGITNKAPMAVAVSIVAQLLQQAETTAASARIESPPQSPPQSPQGLSWRQIRQTLISELQ